MLHLYHFQGLNIVLDVGSGAVHAVSAPVFDVLSFYNNYNNNAGTQRVHEEDIFLCTQPCEYTPQTLPRADAADALGGKYPHDTLKEALSEIDELCDAGLLFAPEPPEDEVSPEGRGAVIKAMCLHVAHDCNMRCAYCFADTGGFSGPRGLMPLHTGKRAVDFLLERAGSRKNLEIDFFGGEPLMNFEVVKELVLYGREREKSYGKHIRFTLTTNGLLLDDKDDPGAEGCKTAFINEYMDNVILSIDGRPEVNDRMRKTVSGEGTYAHIAGKLQRFAEARAGNGTTASLKNGRFALAEARAGNGSSGAPQDSAAGTSGGSTLYYVRGTYTAWNKDFASDVMHLANLGFKNISVEPAVTNQCAPWALTDADLPELFAEYDRLAELMLEREQAGNPISFFHFNVDLDQGPCVYKRVSGCGAGTAYVAVTPDGDIYPCHQFAGDPAFRLGNVLEKDFENKLAPTFSKAHIFAKQACAGCWAKYYCSGGCHASAWQQEGNILTPHRLSCELEKKRLECAIGLAAKRALS